MQGPLSKGSQEMEKRSENRGNKQKTNTEIVDLNPIIHIITSNINYLNTPFREARLPE